MIVAVFAAVLSLADVETAAVAHAPAVTEARARVSEQQALLAASRGTGVPHAFANYANSPQAGPVTGTVQQQLTTVGGSIVLGDIATRDPLVAQAVATLRSAQYSEANAERAERIKVIGLYVDAIRTREVRALRDVILAAAQADHRAAQLRFRNGDAPRLDVVRTDVAVARAQADLAQARADESNARRALAVEIAADSATVIVPQLSDMNVVATAPESADQAIAIALQRRPEVTSARADIAAEEAALRAARRGVLPSVTLLAGYTTGVDTAVPVHGPNISATVDVPVSHVARARSAAEDARLQQAQAREAGAVQSVTVEVSNAYESLHALREAAVASATAQAEALAEVHAAEAGYREGASSSLDLADARRTYAQAAVDYLTARAALAQSALTFQLAVGEGP